MTTFSQSDLATRVLRDLGLVASEETPSAPDLTDAQEIIGSEAAMLLAKGIPIWNGSDQSVPLEYLSLLSRRIGLAVAPSYGLMDAANATLAMAAVERDLKIMAALGPTGAILESDYF